MVRPQARAAQRGGGCSDHRLPLARDGRLRLDEDVVKRQFLAAGDRFASQRQFKEAVLEYRNAVQIDPMFAEARTRLAASYEQSGDRANAFREYVRAADLSPTDVALQLKAAAYLLGAGRVDDALQRAEAVLKQQPGNIDAHILRGNALGGLNNFDEALKEMEEALRLDPTSGAVYTQLALVESARGRQVEAESAFRRAIDLAPTNISARLGLANFYWAANRFTEAGHTLEGAWAMAPTDTSVNHALATFSLATGRVREAERYVKQFADAAATVDAQLMLADYYIAADRSAEAITILTPIASAPHAAPAVQHQLARAYLRAGLTDKAQTVISGLLARTPRDAAALLLNGQLALHQNRADDAVESVKAAVAAQPTSAEAQFVLGRVYAARGDHAGAEAAFREVLKISPSATAAHTERAVLQLATGSPSAALRNAQASVKNHPNRLATKLALIRGLLAARQLDRAQQELEPLLATHAHVAAVIVQSGVLAASRNDAHAARAAFEKALAIDSTSIEALGGALALDLNAGNLDAARRRVTQQLTANAASSALLLLAARTYGSTGDLSAAENALRRAIRSDPTLLPAYSMLGQIYLSQGRLDEALQEFDSLAERRSNPVSALTMSGMILQARNRPSEARTRYEREVTIDPRAAVAANNLAWLYLESGEELNDALRLARNAAEVLPDSPAVLDTLGWAYYRNGMNEAAIGPLVRSVEMEPGNAEYRFHLGLAKQAIANLAGTQ